MRNAKQKKTVPAKNSKAIFWRPRFAWPLRAGKRANANFACSEGFFCAWRAAPFAGLVVFARPAVLAAAFVPGVPAFFCRCAAVLSPACGCPPFFCLACAAWLPFALRRPCSRLAGRLPQLWQLLRLACAVHPFCALFARLFSLVFRLFLPDFFLSKLFSFVAQAATGLYFLPKRK